MPAFEWPFIFNVLVVLFVQETKPVLLFQKNLKQEAWSKASCSFLYAHQIQGVVTNGAAGFFISMHECVFPSIVRTSGKNGMNAWASVTLSLRPIMPERI